MVEGARLESVYTLIAYRGFESLSLRQVWRCFGVFTALDYESRQVRKEAAVVIESGVEGLLKCRHLF